MRPATLALIRDRAVAKGDVREVARLAGIMAAKKTSDLIPLCHPLPLTAVTIDFGFDGDALLKIEASVKVHGKTGVEMEALTAVSVAALTVYDMCKAVDREMTIERIRLEEKSGGKSGHFKRADLVSRDAESRSAGVALRDSASRLTKSGDTAMIAPVIANGRPTAKIGGLPHSLIADDLEIVERLLQQTLAPYRARFGALVKYLNHYRGKRLRPTLLLLVARACGTLVPAHHVLAAVVEMIHTATLVHDDVLDEADTRRHVGTVNSGWGNKVSILLGDLLFTNAFHLSSTIGDARACEWIGEATNRVCAGELLQTVERGNLNLSEADYLTAIEGKTAALTECCGRLGAIYSGADDERVRRLAGFGRNLGIAFQIADDVLDLVGNEETTGKTLGTDLARRKLTLPLIFLLDRVLDRRSTTISPLASARKRQFSRTAPGIDRNRVARSRSVAGRRICGKSARGIN